MYFRKLENHISLAFPPVSIHYSFTYSLSMLGCVLFSCLCRPPIRWGTEWKG